MSLTMNKSKDGFTQSFIEAEHATSWTTSEVRTDIPPLSGGIFCTLCEAFSTTRSDCFTHPKQAKGGK